MSNRKDKSGNLCSLGYVSFVSSFTFKKAFVHLGSLMKS